MSEITTPDYIQDTDYSKILSDYLGNVRNDVDKREGSIIWDAGAPCCIEIAKAYVYVQMMILNCFASTAEAPFMDYRAEEVGLDRDEATYAYRLGIFTDGEEQPFAVPIGTEFSTVDQATLTNFSVDSVYVKDGATVPGSYVLKCETAGVIGNQYFGTMTPVYSVNGLANAEITDILVPGQDPQTTDSLRSEYFSKVKTSAFSGNIAHYRDAVKSIQGVGACQIYPRVLTDSNIVISIIDSTYAKPSDLLVKNVQNALDPYHDNADYKGKGLGIAPLDHYVDVVACTEYVVNVTADITLKNNYTLAQVTSLLEASVENYLLSLRKIWAESDEFNNYTLKKVYVSKIQSALLNTTGIDNVTNVKLNNGTVDIDLTQAKNLQHLPVKGTLTTNVI